MTALQMEKELLRKWHALPDEKRQEALDFVQFLNTKTPNKVKPLQSALGLCADLHIALQAEAIDEARQELWSQFPREDF